MSPNRRCSDIWTFCGRWTLFVGQPVTHINVGHLDFGQGKENPEFQPAKYLNSWHSARLGKTETGRVKWTKGLSDKKCGRP